MKHHSSLGSASARKLRRSYLRWMWGGVECFNSAGLADNKNPTFLQRRSLPYGGPKKPLDVASLAALLRRCRTAPAARSLHRRIAECGHAGHKLLGNALIQAYGKCALVADARAVFDQIYRRDACSWNAMISAYSRAGCNRQAMELFERMLTEEDGPRPDRFTFACVLSACRDVAERRLVHACIVASGVETDDFLDAALVGAYSSSECLPCTVALFGRIPARRQNTASWNFVIDAHARCGDNEAAMRLFQQMWSEDDEGVRANDHTFAMMLGACSDLGESKLIHGMLVDAGSKADVVLKTALVSAYGRHGMAETALALHRQLWHVAARHDTVSWNAVIMAHSQGGRLVDTLELFEEMGAERVRPNCVTFVSILSACADAAAAPEGTRVHACLVASGVEVDTPLGNTLVHMYSECGILHRANALFHRMPLHNAASWSTIISAHAFAGYNAQAIQLFWSMQHYQSHELAKPSSFTFMAVLNASTNLSQLTDAKPIHACIVASGIDLDCALDNALLNMYSKCGSLADARHIFDRMPMMAASSIFSWTALITAYAQAGHAAETLKLYQAMLAPPNGVTFIAILSACSHSGLVDDGRFYFDAIARDHGMAPTTEHYSCMIDLLTRAGLLGEAEDFMKNMPLVAGVLDWLALLGACRIHIDLDRGVRAAKHAIELDPKNSAPFIMLSNLYAAVGI